MKSYLLLIIFISMLKISFGQNGEHPLPFIQQEPKYDTAPRFPGGSDAMMKYFEDSIRYPEPERTKFIQGNVMVKFSVTKEGKVIDVQLVNGVPGGPNLAKESVRVIQSMPIWIPASKMGKPVEAECNLSVPFKIKNKR
ncbi:MAG: TonB family protein [Bacteroidota bacterium]